MCLPEGTVFSMSKPYLLALSITGTNPMKITKWGWFRRNSLSFSEGLDSSNPIRRALT